MCCVHCNKLSEEQKEAVRDLGRKTWTACNILGENTDWVLPQDIGHVATCPLAKHYESLWRAAFKVKSLFKKELE